MTTQAGSQAFEAAHAFLRDRINYERLRSMPYGERTLKLDRMHRLLNQLDRPQAGLPVVHLAGTKGKGSTAAMLAEILQASGYRVGLYTSPHLETVQERFLVDGRPCDAVRFVELVERVKAAYDSMLADSQADSDQPTYFDLTTALALLHFRLEEVDVAVLEVGLGGRLDSTNVCEPVVTTITSISFDHVRQLGSTLGAIAREKAGICKPGVPMVSGVTAAEPRQAVSLACEQAHSPLVSLGTDFDFEYDPPRDLDAQPALGHINYRRRTGPCSGKLQDMAVGLLGRHQGANAAVAMAVCDELNVRGWNVPTAARRAGLANVRWPCRAEVVHRHPTVVLDAAHNLASAIALAATLDESFAARRRVLLFATTQEKDARGMLAVLLPHFGKVVLTRYRDNPRGVPPEELARLCQDLAPRDLSIAADPFTAVDSILPNLAQDDLLCVTGSVFVVAEVRRRFVVGH